MKKKLLLVFSLFLITSSAYAGQFVGCTVVQVVSAGDGNVHAQLSCNMESPPPCATALPYIGFDGTTSAGKRYFAMISMAFAMNSKLTGRIDDAVCAPSQGNVGLLISLQLSK